MDKRLFIVGICKGELMEKALVLQKLLSEKYRLYHLSLPRLHITMEIVENNETDLKLIKESVLQTVKMVPEIPVKADGFICFPPPYKSIGLSIENSKGLCYAVDTLKEQLKKRGLESLKPPDFKWIYHLTLVNTFLADRKWTEKEFFEACQIVDTVKSPLDLKGTIGKLAIWHPIKEEAKMTVGTYALSKEAVTAGSAQGKM